MSSLAALIFQRSLWRQNDILLGLAGTRPGRLTWAASPEGIVAHPKTARLAGSAGRSLDGCAAGRLAGLPHLA
jgi:hypothetical protein